MKFIQAKIPEIIQVIPDVYSDDRGFFMETYQKATFSDHGIPYEFVQDNHSASIKNTLRGLHYQVTHIQGKLVRAVVGEIFDVAVDLRRSSPHFGQWVGVILSAKNKTQLWVPPRFAHGFYTLSETAEVVYKTTDFYDGKGEHCICWDDPELAIDWPMPEFLAPLLSAKDSAGSNFKDAEVFA